MAKTHWNYRVIAFVDAEDIPWQAIYEVHYEDEKPVMYGKEPATIMIDPDDANGMAWVLDRMREALDKPVLVECDFQ